MGNTSVNISRSSQGLNFKTEDVPLGVHHKNVRSQNNGPGYKVNDINFTGLDDDEECDYLEEEFALSFIDERGDGEIDFDSSTVQNNPRIYSITKKHVKNNPSDCK